MSLLDLQSFLQQRIQLFDPTIDVGSGSDADTDIIQPMLRRLGPDPFSVDIRAFIMDRLNQEFPDMATTDGDAITDLLIKPAELLLDPVVRENARVRNSQSFRDPSTLTLDEAQSLGANFFVDLDTGDFAKGTARIYYAAPQGVNVGPSNFVTSSGGLTFFPDGVQSISVDEMLFNTEGSLFYFDISCVAEKAGDQYNIDANSLVSIAGLSGSVKVTNKVRFQNGVQADNTETYIANIKQSITERSLVTQRGIATQLTNAFPGLTRLNVVGFNDPEMERDILEANSIGPVIAAGVHGIAIFDGLNGAKTRRFTYDNSLDASVDFTTLMGPPTSAPVGWVVTLHGAFLGAPPVQDVPVLAVIDSVTLDLEAQVIPNGLTGLIWELRHAVLTLSNIPGGILFPDSPNGTVTVPDDEIHIGGCTDIHVRGTVLDQESMVINVLEDDVPEISGLLATGPSGSGTVILGDLILGLNYNVGDATYNALVNAYKNVDQFQVLSGPGAGIYRVLSASQISGTNPVLTVSPVPPVFTAPVRWKLVDQIHVDLVDPRETRINGKDLQTIQGVARVTTASGISFPTYGVSVGDTLQIKSGPDAKEYTIMQVTPFPAFTVLVLNSAPKFTRSNLLYTIFRPASTDTLQRPMVRIDTIDLLDQNGQPVGTTVPYANPVGAYSTAFSHPGSGIKFDIEDALLGLVGVEMADICPTAVVGVFVPGVALNTKILQIDVFVPDTSSPTSPPILVHVSVTFAGVDPIPLSTPTPLNPLTIVAQINAAYTAAFPLGTVLAVDAGNCLGIIGNITPSGASIVGGIGPASSAIGILFGLNADGSIPFLTSFMVRAPEFANNDTFFTTELVPQFDPEYDVLQTVGGAQIGFFPIGYLFPFPGQNHLVPFGMEHPNAVVLNTTLAPQNGGHIQFGSRSFGRARMLFLSPTTIEIGPEARFATTLTNGATINFLPDFAAETQIVPALPGGSKPIDGVTAPNSNILTSAVDFVGNDVQVGDELIIDFIPITGTIGLADPISNLAFKTLIYSIGGSPDLTLNFSRDNFALAITDVSRQGAADEINSAVGATIATIDPVTQHLVLNPLASMTIRKGGTANALLGLSTTQDTNNASTHAGIYSITQIGIGNILISPATPNNVITESNEQFTIKRTGVQRIGTTTMNANVGQAGLYFADVELVSEGTGDLYDIDADVALVVTGHQADGYYLTTKDSNLTFSTAEDVTLVLSKTINTVGTDDTLLDATVLTGQNIQVNYEASTLTSQIQSFVVSDAERVVNESPLSRHLIPYFVRFDLNYSGGPQPSDIEPSIETLIQALFPYQQLQVSDIQALLSSRGTTSISNPLTLYGIIYNLDRSITLEKSEDRLNVGRLAAFIPDQINLVRQLT